MTPQPPSRDPGVYTRPGAASVRAAALWDAVYELVIGGTVGITNEGAQGLVDQGLAAHEAEPDPHPVYVTVLEGDQRWGASSGLAPHTHEAADSGGLIDYLRTAWGTGHLAAADPHGQYQTAPEVQASVDAALTALKAEPDPFPVYLTQARADLLYLPVTYTPPPPDLSNYYTKAQADAAFLTQAEGDALYQPVGAYLTQATADPLYVNAGVGGDTMAGPLTTPGLTVGANAVALSPNAGNTLQWLATGFFSDSPTKATTDALTSRVATLEAQVATLNAQMGAGASGHYHTMGTWRQTNKATIPVTQVEEAVAT